MNTNFFCIHFCYGGVNITKENSRFKYEVFDDSTKACSIMDEINGGDTNEE